MARDRASAIQGITTLLPKLDDPDPDIRFMQLNDLANILNAPASEYLRTDQHTAARVIERLIKALTDQNGEVQNQALKCTGPLAVRTPNEYIATYIDKITELTYQDNIDISVPITALRTLVVSLPYPPVANNERDIKEAFSGISRVLIPRLVGYVVLPTEKKAPNLSPGLLQQQKNKGYSSDAVDVVIEVVRCYGSMLRDQELAALGAAIMNVISSPQANGVVKKRALAGIAAIAPYYKDNQLADLVDLLAKELANPQIAVLHRRYLVSTAGALSKSLPSRMGPFMNVLAPLILSTLSQDELDDAAEDSDDELGADPETEELREATLVALENLLSSCPAEMQPHWSTSIDSALRYLKYDPNVVDTEGDEEMSGTQDAQSDDGFTEDLGDDDDDEYAELDDDAFGDVEDLSWKVRRCAAKVLSTIISNSSPTDHETLFERIVPVLLSRLSNEREDSVRLEILSALTTLVRKTGVNAAKRQVTEAGNEQFTIPASHKRKRQDSNVSIGDPDLRGLVLRRASPPLEPSTPPSGPQADLAAIVPRIISATVKLWKKASIALKQATVLMLSAVAQSRNGALADHLQQLEDLFADALKSPSGSGSTSTSGSTATAASLQIETLLLISTVAETNGSSVLMPFVIALIPSVTSLVRDRNYKVSAQTLATLEQFVKALTPPRLQAASGDHAIHVEKLYTVVTQPISDVNTDLEVRLRAIQVFGVLLARTSGTTLLSQDARVKGLGILSDRLKNETTRLESARAIGLLAESANARDNIGGIWVQEVAIEMANQLRKADRSLRLSCIEALQYLALNPVTAALFESTTITKLQEFLLPLVRPDDLNFLTPALVILSRIIPTDPEALVDVAVVQALCKVAEARLEGPSLRAYLLVVKVIGEQGFGKPLMAGLLAVGTNGDTHVLGRAIGTLLVFGGNDLGLNLNAFIAETKSKDEAAACLALAVLGEVGLRARTSDVVDMQIFTDGLSSSSDKVRLSAATALGSASSSNISQHLPSILSALGHDTASDHLYLHSVKEILQQVEHSPNVLGPHANDLWQKLFVVSSSEDNRAIGAECVGRLILLDPVTFLSAISNTMDDTSVETRATAISALRFTLSDTSKTYLMALSRVIIPLLKKMLNDSDLSNRRLAILTLNGAIQNQLDLLVAELDQLLPVVIADTYIKKELIKTVKIGPFTHQEDHGMDLRKSAYSTLYALVETNKALPYLNLPAIFDRIQDGVSDDHDIRTLCNLMLSRLSEVDPDETKRRLPALAEPFRKTLEVKPKENAVKQEIEKINEAREAVIRISLELVKNFPSAAQTNDAEMTPWKQYLDYMNKEHAPLVKSLTESA